MTGNRFIIPLYWGNHLHLHLVLQVVFPQVQCFVWQGALVEYLN